MNSALVTIGDEILIGQVTDTNVVWISKALNRLGVSVGEMVTVSDEPGQITATLDRFLGSYDLVIMTGGLGPTKDDLTKQTLAAYFNSPLKEVKEVRERIEGYFKRMGRTLIASNLRQAEVPEACIPLRNNHGTAPGMWFEKDGSILVSLPGVPYEMKGLMEDEVLPRIRKRVEVPNVVHRTIMTQGVPESYLAELLKDWEESLPDCVKLAYLPRPGIVRLRLSISGSCAAKSREMLEDLEGKLLKIIPEHVFGYDDMPLEEALGRLLKEKGLNIATAESCTGGNIARLLTSIPGSSAYVQGSVVAYQNAVKSGVLGVEKAVINTHGAVSEAVVLSMANGVRKLLNADCSIAVSGIAGPDGGTKDKPVGTTWIAVSCGEKSFAKKYLFWGTRDRVIDQASNSGMQLLRRLILDLL
jgi:nicotinamide-nucleotide amidase